MGPRVLTLRRDDVLTLDAVRSLLDLLPDALFFLKDADGRYLSANSAMLQFCGAGRPENLIGKCARDFFPNDVHTECDALDRQVMRARRPRRDDLQKSIRASGRSAWLLSGRWPFAGAGGEVSGVATIARVLPTATRRDDIYERVFRSTQRIKETYREPLDVSALASAAGVSISQLDRDFNQVFGISPRRYQQNVRFEAALDELLSDAPIASIAAACGYTDHSAFTRSFRMALGMSPTEYRRRASAGAAADLQSAQTPRANDSMACAN